MDPIEVWDIDDIPPYTISEESDNVSLVFLDGTNLSIEQLILVARERHPVALSTDTAIHKRIERTHTSMQQAVENNEIIYGVTTGFGGIANTLISRDECSILQENRLCSLKAGARQCLPTADVRAAMVLRVNSQAVI